VTSTAPIAASDASGTTRSSPSPFGVYLHVPFCRHRCDYCAFAAWDDRGELMGRYMRALQHEVAGVAAVQPVPATSVFVGGGTPSLVDADALVEVIRTITLADDAEVTVEVNPEDASEELFTTYRDGGVNRISFGVQSMVQPVLDALGRRHDPNLVATAVDAARNVGISSINLDVIYGAAGETVEQWTRTLTEVVGLNPDHVSAYALTVEPGTALAADPVRHPDDDDQAAKYLVAEEILTSAAMPWYEISNWSREGHQCRHNQLYWAQGDYFGAGCSAHSHRAGRRWWNLRTPERYMDAVESGRPPEAGDERLDDEQRRIEALQLAVRTSDGVPVDALERAVSTGEIDGLVERVGDRFVLTVAGRLLANEVALRLE
jgi:oxygen-independent coproporphyrinogen-3 oxidase